jgi:Domain of unknown function (DUF4251)
MKRFGTWAIISLLLLSACSSSKSTGNISESDVATMVNAKSYAFRADQMFPSGGRTRILNETYLFTVTPSQVVSDLPYAGRAYTANPGSTDGGMRFTSQNFTYEQEAGKKNGWVIKINPKDQTDVRECLLTVYANGNADLSITSNNRQMIRYSGYLQAIPKK